MTEYLKLLERVYRSVETRSFFDRADKFLREAWDLLVEFPTSKTGRYHPEISNVTPYGLVNHVIRVVHFAEHMCEEENVHGEEREIVMVAILFHDIGKCYGKYKTHVYNGCTMLQEREFDSRIVNCVATHMSHWDRDGTLSQAIEEGRWGTLERIVAHSDYLASRREIITRDEEYFILNNTGQLSLITDVMYRKEIGAI